VIEGAGSTPRPVLPVGTVTFLRTDVEGSMGLALLHGSAWDGINAAHLDLLRGAVAANGGVSVRTEGDALFAAFPEAGGAIRSAVTVVKSRTAPNERTIREFRLSQRGGLQIGEPLVDFEGVMSGMPRYAGATKMMVDRSE